MRRVRCPECERALNVPDDVGGKTVRCPGCRHTFKAPRRAEDEDEPRVAVRTEKPAARRATRDEEEEHDDRPRRRPARDEDEDDRDDRPRRRSVRDYEDDEDDRPRRKKRKKKANQKGLVGLIVLLAVVPFGLLLFLLSFWYEFAAGFGIFVGVVVMVAGGIMTWVVVRQNGGSLGMENVPYILRGGAALLIMQIKYALEMPRLLAAWVGLEVFGLVLMIACACVMGAVHPSSPGAASSGGSASTGGGSPGGGSSGGSQPREKPAPPKVTGDATLDQALADLGKSDESAVQGAIDKLSKTSVNGQHQALVAQKLAAHLNDSNPFVRRSAVQALGVWGTPNEVPALLNVLGTDDDFGARNNVLQVIGKFRDERALKPVALAFQDGRTRIDAAKAFKEMGPMAETEVLGLLNTFSTPEKVFDRNEVILILKDIGTLQSVPALQKEIAADNVHTKRNAQDAVAAIKARKQ
jgi:hypothetical protein